MAFLFVTYNHLFVTYAMFCFTLQVWKSSNGVRQCS